MNLHQIQKHPEFVEGCFGCKLGTLQLSPGDAASNKGMSQKKWDKELDLYRSARKQGIQPAGTSTKQVQKAIDDSNKVGKAYDANTGGFKGQKMTAIVGIQGKGWAVLASDSMVSYDDKPFYARGMDKVITRNEYAWAFAGDALAGDITTHFWKPPKVSKTMTTDNFFMTKVIPSLKQCLTNNGYVVDKEDKEAGFDALVLVNGIIYQTETTYGWMRDDKGLYAIGSGGRTALGVMAGLNANEGSMKIAEEIATKAIKISSDYNIYVGGDVQITTQRRK